MGLPEWNCCGTMDKPEAVGTISEEQVRESSTVSDSDDFQPCNKKQKLSLSKTKTKARIVLSPTSRFNTTVTDAEVEKNSKGCIPDNTARSTAWAMRVFQQWIEQRNKRVKEQFPRDMFDKPYSVEMISSCLQRFVAEAKRADGTPYPPRTLFQLLSGLLRHSKQTQANPPNFLDRKDFRFKQLHGACDATFRALHEQGIGTEKKSAEFIDTEIEDKLWDSGVLDINTPEKLQNAVFFYIGKVCCLRGGEEQRQLKPSQFTRYNNQKDMCTLNMGLKTVTVGFISSMLKIKGLKF